MKNVILDFSRVYLDEKDIPLSRIDMSDIEGANMYCSDEAKNEIRRRLKDVDVHGIHFLDNGNYHYVSELFLEKIHHPFSLFLIDYHNDMQQPLIHDLTTCGSWAREVLENHPYLQQFILIGPSNQTIQEIPKELKDKIICISIQEIENHEAWKELSNIDTSLPAYISIDKDVLNRYESRTNWNQGNMSIKTLELLLELIFKHQQVIGVDICGECNINESYLQLNKDLKINEITNKILYQFISYYLKS